MIRRWHWLINGPMPKNEPFVASARLLDISNTLTAAIMNVPSNCLAIAVRPYIGSRAIADVERAARHKGLRILWMRHRAGKIDSAEKEGL